VRNTACFVESDPVGDVPAGRQCSIGAGRKRVLVTLLGRDDHLVARQNADLFVALEDGVRDRHEVRMQSVRAILADSHVRVGLRAYVRAQKVSSAQPLPGHEVAPRGVDVEDNNSKVGILNRTDLELVSCPLVSYNVDNTVERRVQLQRRPIAVSGHEIVLHAAAGFMPVRVVVANARPEPSRLSKVLNLGMRM
jgi:hypothetical protein